MCRAAVLGLLAFAALIPALCSQPKPGGSPPINLGPLIPVSPAGSGVHWWVRRASGESNGQVLMVCGTRTSPRHNAAEGFVYVSHDGGRTWQETLVESSTQWSSEHSCATGPDGRAYFVGGASNTDLSLHRHAFGHMYLYSSDDAGMTWGSPLLTPFLDWTAVAVDRTGGTNRGRIYVLGNHLSDGRGEWIPERPALLTSVDGGRTVSGPVFPPAPTEFLRGAAFPLGTEVTNDGTLISVIAGYRSAGRGFFSATNPNPTPGNWDLFHEVFCSTDGGRTFNEPVVLSNAGKTLGWVSLTIDRKKGTVYAAWIGEDQGHRRVILARSGDKGKTWSSSVAIEGDTGDRQVSKGDVGVAVGRDGVIGLVWPAIEGACVRFAVSADEGRSFSVPVDLGSCERGVELTPQAYSTYLYSTPIVEDRIRHAADVHKLGVSMRVEPWSVGAAGQTALLVDGAGRFHPIWREVGQGMSELWTRTVAVGSPEISSVDVKGLKDITEMVAVHFSNNRFHSPTSTFYVDIALTNLGSDAICGPLRLEAGALRSDYGSAEIDNADNGVRGEGGIWDVTEAGESAYLRAGATSRPRTLAFKVNDLTERDTGNPVALGLKVFGNVGAMCHSGR